jgi:hypothetical protein
MTPMRSTDDVDTVTERKDTRMRIMNRMSLEGVVAASSSVNTNRASMP